MGWIRQAVTEVEAFAQVVGKHAPLTEESVAIALDTDQLTLELLKKNWHSRIYGLSIPEAPALIVKQSVTRNCHFVEQEYENLRRLYLLEEVAVPKPVAFLRLQNALIMERVDGVRADRIFGRWEENLCHKLLDQAAKTLARIHRAYGIRSQPFRAERYWMDFRAADDLLQKKDRDVIWAILDLLDGMQLPVAQLYIDYDPVNAIWSQNRLIWLDPPSRQCEDDIFWDVSTFTFGARRAMWRMARVGHAQKEKKNVRDAFMRGYLDAGGPLGERRSAEIMIALFELQRVLQMSVWQQMPIPKLAGARFRAGLLRPIAKVLLRSERKRLLNELAQAAQTWDC